MASAPRPGLLIAVGLLALGVAGPACGGGDAADTGTTAGQAEVPTVEQQAEPDADLIAKARELIGTARQPQMGKTQKEAMRIAEAQGELLMLAEKEPAAIAPLIAALKKPDYELIVDLHSFYIQLGRPGSEKVLLEALNRKGFSEETSPMALAFLASGNERLIRGTRAWARANGLTISGQPSGIGPRWGSMGAAAPTLPAAPPAP